MFEVVCGCMSARVSDGKCVRVCMHHNVCDSVSLCVSACLYEGVRVFIHVLVAITICVCQSGSL